MHFLETGVLLWQEEDMSEVMNVGEPKVNLQCWHLGVGRATGKKAGNRRLFRIGGERIQRQTALYLGILVARVGH